jgi:hypothetical protein
VESDKTSPLARRVERWSTPFATERGKMLGCGVRACEAKVGLDFRQGRRYAIALAARFDKIPNGLLF